MLLHFRAHYKIIKTKNEKYNFGGWISTYYKCADDNKINLTCFGLRLVHQAFAQLSPLTCKHLSRCRIFFLSPCFDSCQVSSFIAVALNPQTYFSFLRENPKEETHFLTGTCLCMSHVILSRMRIYIKINVAGVLINVI